MQRTPNTKFKRECIDNLIPEKPVTGASWADAGF
jgi:hypothetical protein